MPQKFLFFWISLDTGPACGENGELAGVEKPPSPEMSVVVVGAVVAVAEV